MFEIIEKGLEVEPYTNGIKYAVEKTTGFYEKKRDDAIYRYVQQVYLGTVSEEKKEYEKIIHKDDEYYYMLLNAAVQDDDNKKSAIYANVYINIEKDKIKQEHKFQILKIVKTLSYSTLLLIPKLYIYKNYHTKGSRLLSFIETIEKEHPFETNELINNIVLNISNKKEHKQKPTIDIKDICHSPGIEMIPEHFDYIAESIFLEEDLTPESQNIEVWNKVVATFHIFNKEEFAYLENLLNTINIKLEGVFVINDKDCYNKFLIVLGNVQIKESMIEHYNKLSKMTTTIKITFDENTIDNLPDIDGQLIYLKKGNKESENNFLSLFQ